ncbi:MAG: type IX secretion system membrane protein PorP/SprF [Flavobacteriales bacterium]|nr:type IX secretion system membrane protein PorP/SprF [Flavobacteriales bacterium]
MRYLALLLLLASGPAAVAQQIAQYTQYVFNHFAVNPAVAGSKDCLDVRLGYRKQWVGFKDAPVTAWASLHGAIRPKGKPYQQNRHGIGAFIEADDAGPIGYTHFLLAYAYHIQTGKERYLSFGTFAGMKQFKLDVASLTLNNYNDPVVDSKGSVNVYPMVSPGVWLYGKQGWTGLSFFQLLGNPIPDVGVDARFTRHYLFSTGRRFRLSKEFALVPSTLVKMSPGSPLAIDLNASLDWRRKLSFGVGYRNQDAMTFMLRVPFLQYFSFGYSYDITTSKLKVASSNTHEFILAIYPCKPVDPSKRIVSCPVFE